MIYSLVYVSTATISFSKRDLEDLLQKSRNNNTALDITGLLLFRDGNFMQVLEGDEVTVNALYKKIVIDPRHSGSMTLLTHRADERAFGDWSMAFRDLNDPEVRAIPGFSSFLTENASEKDLFRDPTRVQRLLQFFKQTMR